MNIDPRDYADEGAERLEERALEGLKFGEEAFQRLRETLPGWLRPAGQLVLARAIAVIAAVVAALAMISPVHLAQLAERISRSLGNNEDAK